MPKETIDQKKSGVKKWGSNCGINFSFSILIELAVEKRSFARPQEPPSWLWKRFHSGHKQFFKNLASQMGSYRRTEAYFLKPMTIKAMTRP